MSDDPAPEGASELSPALSQLAEKSILDARPLKGRLIQENLRYR